MLSSVHMQWKIIVILSSLKVNKDDTCETGYKYKLIGASGLIQL
jgi:hypothetical protein